MLLLLLFLSILPILVFLVLHVSTLLFLSAFLLLSLFFFTSFFSPFSFFSINLFPTFLPPLSPLFFLSSLPSSTHPLPPLPTLPFSCRTSLFLFFSLAILFPQHLCRLIVLFLILSIRLSTFPFLSIYFVISPFPLPVFTPLLIPSYPPFPPLSLLF